MTPGPSRTDELTDELPQAMAAVRAYVRRLAGPGVDPEDLLQDVMERALRYRHAYQPGRQLVPWLRRMALRLALDQRARQRRQPRALEDEPGVEARDVVADRDEVQRLLARLTPVERDVLVRFHQQGCSVGEIAAALGLPAGTVKSHLHRARRRLAERGPEHDA